MTDASTYGIRIDAARVGDGSQSPYLGVAQNRAVLNNAGLVPGAVVTNTVVANSGVAGIYFGGTADTANDANSVALWSTGEQHDLRRWKWHWY